MFHHQKKKHKIQLIMIPTLWVLSYFLRFIKQNNNIITFKNTEDIFNFFITSELLIQKQNQ